MKLQHWVRDWFEKWEKADFENLPITDNFEHTSPFGTIRGKKEYMEIVKANRDKFLGYRFLIHDAIYEESHAVVRYTATQGEFRLDVSEWYYPGREAISKIIAYYHIGEIRADRQLEKPGINT